MPSSPRMKDKKAPKRGAPKDEDDVDERGNIADLIDYDYESDNESDSQSLTKSELYHIKKYGRLPKRVKESVRSPRKAALHAREKIARELKNRRNDTPSSSDSTYVTEDDKNKNKNKQSLKKGFLPKKKLVVESESESDGETLGEEDTDEDDEDADDEDEEEDEEEDEDADAEESGFNGISISFGGGLEEPDDRMVPKRHNMKKESEDVRKFVKLVTNPVENDTIDTQIDQFKALESPKQRAMLEALEKRSDYVKKEQPLMFRLLQMRLTPEMMAMVMTRYNSLNSMDVSSGEYYKLRAWMEKLVSMPLGLYKEMPVNLNNGPETCAPFMDKARKCLDDAIYGQDEAKLQIMQFIASKIANPTASGLSLLLLGPPGIGKTSLIKNGIAKALDWPFQFISLGGDSDSSTYTGHQFVYEGSHCGRIANCLAQAKSMSMVMMFDELDKISATSKGEEIQNLLVHITDPVQNMEFEDKYLSGIPLDLSRTMFVFSGNDITKIDRILMDRMVVVNLSGYQSKEKIAIAEKFLLPAALKEVNLCEKVAISREILQHILDTYAKEETGVRELKRCIEQIAQRVNMLRMFNVKELPFHIPGFTLPFVLKKEHVDLFLKKKDIGDKVPFGMYT
jgi:ATP-dependent Lon protease